MFEFSNSDVSHYYIVSTYVMRVTLTRASAVFIPFINGGITSCSVKGEEGQQFIYSGDRQAEDIVHFSLRVANPPVRPIKDTNHLKRLKKETGIFFAYIGDANGGLWVCHIIITFCFIIMSVTD